MEHYKTLPTSQRPMPTLKVGSEAFTNEWYKCWKDPGRNISHLMSMADPFITHWYDMLTKPSYPKDINYVTLCRMVSDSPSGALKRLEEWMSYLDTKSGLRGELTYLFIEHLRRSGYFPEYTNPRMAEYVIANDYKLRLRNTIKRVAINQHAQELQHPTKDLPETSIEPDYPDHLLIKNLDFNPWQRYLFYWRLTGRPLTEIAENIRVPRGTFYHEERKIWHQLKMKFSGEAE